MAGDVDYMLRVVADMQSYDICYNKLIGTVALISRSVDWRRAVQASLKLAHDRMRGNRKEVGAGGPRA
jgi:hypothetical protein